MGRTFEIISEIKVLEPAGNHREEEEEAEGQDEIDWEILTPSPYPSLRPHFHVIIMLATLLLKMNRNIEGIGIKNILEFQYYSHPSLK